MLLGNNALWFSGVVILIGMTCYAVAFRTGRQGYLRVARTSVYFSFLGLAAAAAYLWYLILTHQFQVAYVARYSSLEMPLKYVVASFWGGQEGTFLLWAAYGALLSSVTPL